MSGGKVNRLVGKRGRTITIALAVQIGEKGAGVELLWIGSRRDANVGDLEVGGETVDVGAVHVDSLG